MIICQICGTPKEYAAHLLKRPNYGKYCSRKCQNIGHSKLMAGRPAPWSRRLKGIKKSPEFCRKISIALTGRKFSNSHRKAIARSARNRKYSPLPLWRKIQNSECQKGSKNHNWQGGITPKNQAIRNSLAYKNWRQSVFLRDNWTCQLCNKRGCALHADHIKPFSLFPELRLEVSNGRTLCIDCHKNTDTYLGGRIKLYVKTL